MANRVMRYQDSRRRSQLRKRRALIVIVIAIIIIALIAGAYFLFFAPKDGDLPKEPGKTPSTQSSQSSAANSVSSKNSSSSAVSTESTGGDSQDSSASVPEVKDDPSITGRTVGTVFIYGDTGLEIFKGTADMTDSYKRTIQQFADKLGSGVKVYNMVVPTHIEFALPPRYKDVATSEKDVIDSIYSSYKSNITPVNVYDILSQKRNEYIYFNTDHHWTALGAYYGYTQFAKAAGFEPVDIKNLEKKSIEGFLGTLYSLSSKDKALEKNPDTIDYYKIPGEQQMTIVERNKTTPMTVDMYADFPGQKTYSVFIWGDNKECVIKTDNKNGKKIAVGKESYGNAFIPYLAANYQEIHVIDSRYFPDNAFDYIKEKNIPEVLFINNIMSASAGIRVKELENLMTK